MYYYGSKLVWFFLEPTNLLLILAGLGIMLTRRRPRAGRALALAAVALLAAAGLSPLSTVLMQPLEQRFPPFQHDGRAVAGFIVLGGAVDADITFARGALSLNEAGERVTSILDLHRRYPDAQVVYTGGPGELTRGVPEADAVELALRQWVPQMQAVFERESRNTVENAAFTRALLAPRPGERWLLVTSASHMPRSIGIFRKAGFDVLAYPVDYRTLGHGGDLAPFFSSSGGLRRTDLAAKEWAGLLFAYLTGKSSALFPAP